MLLPPGALCIHPARFLQQPSGPAWQMFRQDGWRPRHCLGPWLLLHPPWGTALLAVARAASPPARPPTWVKRRSRAGWRTWSSPLAGGSGRRGRVHAAPLRLKRRLCFVGGTRPATRSLASRAVPATAPIHHMQHIEGHAVAVGTRRRPSPLSLARGASCVCDRAAGVFRRGPPSDKQLKMRTDHMLRSPGATLRFYRSSPLAAPSVAAKNRGSVPQQGCI